MHPNSTINLYNPNERLVIQFHFRFDRLGYAVLGFIMVSKRVRRTLHKRILASTLLFQMCLAIYYGPLDVLGWDYATSPKSIWHSNFTKIGTKVDIWLTN